MQRFRVLVLDDDFEMRRLLRVVLEQSGFVVDEAPNGLRLISQLSVQRPDVIVLDVMMSWINGIDLCRSLKRNLHYSDIPVCLISGRRTSSADVAEGMRSGASAYYCKPIDWDRMIPHMIGLASHYAEPAAPLYN